MEELDLKQLAGILWRKKFILIFIILVFCIAGIVYTFNFVEPMYKSTCTIILGRVTSSNDNFQDITTYQDSEMISQSDITLNSSLIETYSELVKSKSLIHEVGQALNSKIDEEEIMKSISVSRVNNSDLLEVTATNKDPKLARDIVKSVVGIFSENIKEIYNISNVYVIDDATVDYVPYNINHVRDILIFTLIGIFVSLAYVPLYNIIDNTVKGSYDIETVLKSKILITIPFDKKNKKEELITVNDPKSVISETFRTLRTNVQFSSINSKGSKTLLITSCLLGEGKSYISANLAITFAQAGKKVIIVDSDMRRGRQSKIFNIPNENGLSNYISNLDNNGMELNWSIGKFIKETNITNLNIITAGNVPPNPSELLESEKVIELIEELKKFYDIVIFDGAPILPITDSLILGRLLENTMLVSVYNKTKRDNLQKAKNSIENVGGKIIGIVLNKTTETSSEYVGNYYYYGKDENEKFTEKLKRILPNKRKINNVIKKIKSIRRRIAEKSIVNTDNKESVIDKKDITTKEELDRRKAERESLEKQKHEEEAKIKAEEKAKLKEEKQVQKEEERKKKEKEKQIALAERAKKEAELAAEKAKREAELAVERAKEEAIMAEEKAKREEEERIRKEEDAKRKAELDKKKAEEREIKKKENAEKRQALKEDFNRKWAKFKEQAGVKKEAFIKWTKEKKEELSKKYDEYKVKRAEEKAKREEEARIKAEERAKKEAELARIAEEERKKREEEEKILAAERAKEEAILAVERAKKEEEERIRREEEERLRAEERAKKEAELAIIREQERVKREEERIRREAERAQREAERIKKEEELRRRKEEEKRKKEEERARVQEIKAYRELELARQREEEKIKREEEKIRKAEDAKYTDEYLEENLYPKTKYNKF